MGLTRIIQTEFRMTFHANAGEERDTYGNPINIPVLLRQTSHFMESNSLEA